MIGGTWMQVSFNLGWGFGSVGEGMALVGKREMGGAVKVL
jgi:hypothetical protein